MDAGWLKTADKYYELGVEKILDSVYDALKNDTARTFTQGDIYYFRRWYNGLNDTMKENVKSLVEKG